MILRLEILFQMNQKEISKLHWAKMKMRHQTTMNLDHNQKDLDQTPNQQQRQERFFGFFWGEPLVRFRKTPFKSGNFGYVSHLVKPSESLKLYQGASCCYNRPLKSKERCFYEFEILNFIKCIFVSVRRYFRSRQGR